MTFLDIQNVRKTYGDVTAVDEVSLSIEEGEFVSILGPSGSGKTTTLRMIAGFEEPDEGSIVVDGENLDGLPPEDRDMSMIFQRLALFPHMSVHDNIAFGLKLGSDASKDEIDRRVTEALELVELEGYGDRGITDLNGGEQQRVALARSIVVQPKVLLYDEPLSDLDRKLRETMRREISALHNRLGITSVYVTHNQREALTLSDRVAVMEDGQVVQFDTPAEIYENPKSEFVADFIGESNFISGSIVKQNGQAYFQKSDLSLPVETTEGDNLYIRPEDIRLHPNSQSSNEGYDCTVRSVVPLGSTTEYTVELPDGTTLLVTDLGMPKFEEGDQVTAEISDYGLLGGSA